jgi:hypothetical protein
MGNKVFTPIINLAYSCYRSDETTMMRSLDLMMLGIALMAVQVWDAWLTARGISHFGIAAEGNILLRFLMDQYGYINALILAKTAALCVIVGLVFLAQRIVWLPHALRAVVVVYIFAAIIPWSIILVKVI